LKKFNFFLLLISTVVLMAQSPIPKDAKLEKVFSSGLQLEGPVWKDGVGLLFSDIKGVKVYQLPTDGSEIKVYLQKSDSSNGLTLDKNSNLLLAQMGRRRIARQETNGSITVLASLYNGKKFNSPNDLVVKSDGSIFFTDPDFNIPVGGSKEILINGIYVRGIYRLSPKGNITLLDASFDKPNGICFSPDEKKLYVNESPKGEIYIWDVEDDSTIANKKLFYKITVSGYSDGMKVDPQGNLYCTGPTGVWIISPEGKLLDRIATNTLTSENPSNCAWGDADRKTLYITTNSNLLRIRMANTDIDEQGSLLPHNFQLFQNYPNPFNPSTTIYYQVPVANTPNSAEVRVSLKVYDVLGKEISTLVDEHKQPGIYSSLFVLNSTLSSGVYFYELTADGFRETKKMMLIQ
jgi:gluconolactonase